MRGCSRTGDAALEEGIAYARIGAASEAQRLEHVLHPLTYLRRRGGGGQLHLGRKLEMLAWGLLVCGE